jgi:hypothetical protein
MYINIHIYTDLFISTSYMTFLKFKSTRKIRLIIITYGLLPTEYLIFFKVRVLITY